MNPRTREPEAARGLIRSRTGPPHAWGGSTFCFDVKRPCIREYWMPKHRLIGEKRKKKRKEKKKGPGRITVHRHVLQGDSGGAAGPGHLGAWPRVQPVVARQHQLLGIHRVHDALERGLQRSSQWLGALLPVLDRPVCLYAGLPGTNIIQCTGCTHSRAKILPCNMYFFLNNVSLSDIA